MRTTLTLLLLLFILVNANAQTTNSRGIYTNKNELEDIHMGWMQKLSFKTPTKAFAQNGWTYPVNQVAASEKLGAWLQETYDPVGLLGDIKLEYLSSPASKLRGTKSYGYNESEKDNRFALPNSYGAMAKFHFCLSKTSEHRFWPTQGHHCNTVLHIMANNVETFTKQVVALSSPTDYYFIMPTYTAGQPGVYDKEYIARQSEYRNFPKSTNLKNYQHHYNPGEGSQSYVVIMTKDNKPLPFEKVTVAQFIAQLEEQFPKLHLWATNDNLIYENYLANAKKGIQVLKQEMKDKMQEFVYFSDVNQQIQITDLANIGSSGKVPIWIKTEQNSKNLDDWGKVLSTNTNYPLLRLKKGVKEACATSGPQWIVFNLTIPADPSYGGNVKVMENFVTHFNYDYVYHYFFGKEKPATAYQPVGKTTADVNGKGSGPVDALSNTAQKKKADKSVLFFEDFSSVADGTSPAGWTTDRSSAGDKPVAVALSGQEGKWLKLKGTASPKSLVYPVGGDFELSYDLIVHKGDVPWGTPGIELEMQFASKDGSTPYMISTNPGDMNRADAAGWVEMYIGGASGCKVSSYYSVPEFTGSKPVNKVTIIMRKKGETLSVFNNKNKLYECATGFQPGASLTELKFKVNHKNIYYLGNVELRRL